MSYAWHQLRCAVRALNRPYDRRARLTNAYSSLIKLRARDLPGELVFDFDRLTGGIARFPSRNVSREIKTLVASLDDDQVEEAIATIGSMCDVLEMYQPRRNRPMQFDMAAIGLAGMGSAAAATVS